MKKKLKEECYITMGQSPKGDTYNFENIGTPFLQGRRTFGRMYPTIDTWTTNPIKIAKKDSVLMSVRAPVGDMNIANRTLCIGRGLCSLEMKNGNNIYLYYLLQNNIDRLKRKSSGTVFDSVNSRDIENLELDFDNEDKQKKIAKILTDIDKKIELNNHISDNLEQMSKELYDQWFVDFEFPDKNKNPYKSFGGKMIDSEVGKIPEGWRVGYISDGILTSIMKSGINFYDYEKKYVATADVDGVSINNYQNISYSNKPSRANMQPIQNSVWFAKMQSSKKNILIDGNCKNIIDDYIFSTGFMGLECKKNSVYYIWNYINTESFSILKDSMSTGTLMAGLSNSVMNNFKYTIPSQRLLDEFNEILSSYYSTIFNNNNMNTNLQSLKNILLSKLMNGEIDLENINI